MMASSGTIGRIGESLDVAVSNRTTVAPGEESGYFMRLATISAQASTNFCSGSGKVLAK
ncbi:MAG: hypothetical protein JO119_09970, partial [Acidobacteria bacterium]|nr:hypothetical protein [Acidobacteriota bacterium]